MLFLLVALVLLPDLSSSHAEDIASNTAMQNLNAAEISATATAPSALPATINATATTTADAVATATASAMTAVASNTATAEAPTAVAQTATAAAVATATATAPVVVLKQGVPEGFEELDAPHETDVDVEYGGLKIGSFRAIFTPKTILFSHPEEIVSKIPAVKFDDVPRVVTALTGELPTHAEVICGHIVTEGCGKITPEVAGVVFNEDQFKAEVFVNSSLLAEQDTHKDKILPPAPDVYSAIHSFNGGVTGSNGKKQNYSLITNSTYAYGAGRVNTIGIFSEKEKQLNTLTGSVDRWGLDNKFGYFDSRSTELLPQVPMLGVSTGTSLNTNLALRDAAGTRLSIFLPQRAYVSIIHNGVIYSTDFYEAGNQVLNTDALPDGTYDVTLRIRDTDGVTTEETRFFAKNFSIPPEDQPIYYGQLGAIRDTDVKRFNVNANRGVIATMGTVQRLNDIMGGTASADVVKDQLFVQGGAFLLLPPDHQLRGSVLLSTSQDVGVGVNYLGYGLDKKLSLTSDVRLIRSGKTALVAEITDPISQSSKQVSQSAAYQLTDMASVAVQGNMSQSGSGSRKYSYGPALRYDFWRSAVSSLSLTADSAQTEKGMVSSMFLRYSMRMGAWGLDAEQSKRFGSKSILNGATQNRNGRITWNDDQTPGEMTVAGADVQQGDSSRNFGVDLEHRGPMGNLKLLGQRSSTDTGNTSFYSGNFGFSVVQADGHYTWAGNQQQTSGIVVKNTGNSSNVPMTVLVNNSEQGTFNTGEPVTLFITPYQTYQISIKPKKSEAIDYDGGVKRVTLYPGNVLPMVWVINRINVVLGHVVMPDGKPLVGAKLEEARNISITDEEGMFQGELLELNKITFSRAEEKPPEISSIREDTGDLFADMYHSRSTGKKSATMTEEQRQMILALYGEDELANIAASTPKNGALPDLAPPVEAHAPEPEKAAQDAEKPKAPESKVAEIAQQMAAFLLEGDKVAAPKPATDKAAPVALSGATEETDHPAPPPASAYAPQAAEAAKPLLPAVHCVVELPEMKEMNGVYIYPEPLVCHPVPLDEPKTADKEKETKPEEQHTSWSPYLTPTKVSKLIRPLLSVEHEFAMAFLNGTETEKDSHNAVVVQLGAYQSEAEAVKAKERVMAQFTPPAPLAPFVMKSDLGARGVYYRLRMGQFTSVAEAKNFCAQLTARHQDCIVPGETMVGEAQPQPKMRSAQQRFAGAYLKHLSPERLPEPVIEEADAENAEAVDDAVEVADAGMPDMGLLTPPLLLPKPERPAMHVAAAKKVKPAAAKPVQVAQAAPVEEPKMVERHDNATVQLGAFRSEAAAHERLLEISDKINETHDKTPHIVRVYIADKGVYYRLRLGYFPTNAEAKQFCALLSARGVSCIVPVDRAAEHKQPEAKAQAPAPVMEVETMGGPYIPVDDISEMPPVNPVQ